MKYIRKFKIFSISIYMKACFNVYKFWHFLYERKNSNHLCVAIRCKMYIWCSVIDNEQFTLKFKLGMAWLDSHNMVIRGMGNILALFACVIHTVLGSVFVDDMIVYSIIWLYSKMRKKLYNVFHTCYICNIYRCNLSSNSQLCYAVWNYVIQPIQCKCFSYYSVCFHGFARSPVNIPMFTSSMD